MLVEFSGRSWNARDEETVVAALHWRDARRGAEFWISEGEATFPCLGVWISGDEAAVHFFPTEGHPGYRCVGDRAEAEADDATLFVFEGCDPQEGAMVPSQFVLSFEATVDVVTHFFRARAMSPAHPWVEL